MALDPGSDGVRLYLRARELRDAGLTYRGIADQLAAEGFRPERGRALWPSTVRGVLMNPRVAQHAAA